jgi:DNA-binding MarR family transcriptional regulator
MPAPITPSSASSPLQTGLVHPPTSFQHELQTLFDEAAALAHQLRKTAAATLRQDDCPAGALSLLQSLDQQGPQTVPAIARARALSRQNVQVLVNRLHARSLVTLTPNPAHKRSALVQLTSRGHALFAAASRQEMQTWQALLPHIPEAQLLPASTLLRQLRRLLGGAQPPAAPLPPEPPASPMTTASPKRPRRKRPATAIAEPPPPSFGEPEEGEFPVNLL